jgi:hypothetical protein
MPLKLYDFDVILSIDWLSKYRMKVDCFTKKMTIQDIGGKRVVLKGERKVVPSYLICIMTAGKLTLGLEALFVRVASSNLYRS